MGDAGLDFSAWNSSWNISVNDISHLKLINHEKMEALLLQLPFQSSLVWESLHERVSMCSCDCWDCNVATYSVPVNKLCSSNNATSHISAWLTQVWQFFKGKRTRGKLIQTHISHKMSLLSSGLRQQKSTEILQHFFSCMCLISLIIVS